MAQTLSFNGRRRVRKFFGKIPEVAEMPNLIEVQKASYDQFLMVEEPKGGRPDEGLQAVFKSVFPITDFSGASMLEFVSYEFEPPKFDVDECRQRDLTYAAPLKVTLRLIVFDIDEDTGAKSIKDIKEQSRLHGRHAAHDQQRYVHRQRHRARYRVPDAPFAGRLLRPRQGQEPFFRQAALRCARHPVSRFLARHRVRRQGHRLCPYRPPPQDPGDVAADGARHGRRRNPVDVLHEVDYTSATARAGVFRSTPETPEGRQGDHRNGRRRHRRSRCRSRQEADPASAPPARPTRASKALKATDEDLYGNYLAEDIVNYSTGEIYLEAGDEIDEKTLPVILPNGFDEIPVLGIDHINVGAYIRNTLTADKNENRQDALFDIYRVMRPGEPPTMDSAEAMFNSLFFDAERYDLSAVGRVKMNMRLDLDVEDTVRILRKDDILAVVKMLVELRDGKGEIDDIDNLGNRRVRSVGELMENQYRLGLLRMERAIKERMSSIEIDTVMPQDLINAKPAAAAVREFFGSSQLSQFMDQVNPLSEITHKRRLSALGPGGLTRERAGFEVRDVHPTHYGRICPIETPEGPNIGLINSLATFARVNKYGFIESPYRKIVDGKVTNDVLYLSAMEEAKYYVAQANVGARTPTVRFAEEFVVCRHAGEVMLAPRDSINLMDVSPKQVVSVAAALIPFLENDDANRALMGSNMQRQAVPLLRAEAPFVGTGMEPVVARDSGAAIGARRGGVVDQVDATRIVIRATEDLDAGKSGVDIYRLQKFQRSNQNTCVNQRPLVTVGDDV